MLLIYLALKYNYSIDVFLMDPTTVAIVAIVVAAGSEIIALSPLKSNSWAQLIINVLKTVFPKRK